MDLKQAGNRLYQVGLTRAELGGSHLTLIRRLRGGQVPRVDAVRAKRVFAAVHQAIERGHVRSCHDLSEGGLAVALAEMAFAGQRGARVRLDHVPHDLDAPGLNAATLLFAESNSRFVCEVPENQAEAFEQLFADLPCRWIGTVTDQDELRIDCGGTTVIEARLAALKEAWQAPLRWS
jgi:phosphoribosylformylglycinamidine synthase